MPVRFKCPSCSERISIDNDSTSKKIRCPECNTLIAIPAPPANKKQEVGIQADRKPAVSNSRKRKAEDEETPEMRTARKVTPAKSGSSVALLAVASLLLLSCLLVGSGGAAWFLFLRPQRENNEVQAKLDVKKGNDELKSHC